jgi:sensor domain DACNV-containing protein
MSGRRSQTATPEQVFPADVVRTLRNCLASKGGWVAGASDDLLAQLLSTIFWAGLETYEGQHNPIGVVYLGTSEVDFVFPEGSETGAAPLYQWKVLRFATPRAFEVGELVKLAVAGAGRRIYTAVNIARDHSLVISGLVHEGFNVDPDPFVKIIASRPGCLSIRSGSDLLLGYERGTILTREHVGFSGGPVRRALEAMSRAADLDEDAVGDYVHAVRSLVGEMAAHGRGGILIVSDEEHPDITSAAPYRMVHDSSLSALLKLARRLGRAGHGGPRSRTAPTDAAFGIVLRNAFLTEAERVTQEIGALTAIDGALVVDRNLALRAFGVVLPVGHPAALAEASDEEGRHVRPIDLGSRGTRHRAGATYAADHPGAIVFVASEDGQISCMFRDPPREHTLIWRLGAAADTHTRARF